MARFFVFFVIVGGTSLTMYATKPTQAEYLQALQSRAAGVSSAEQNTLVKIRVGDPMHEMVTAQPPVQLLKQTRVDDYYLVNVFTTAYEAPGYGTRYVRTYGLFSSLLSYQTR